MVNHELSSTEIGVVAEQFVSESEAQTAMWDVGIRYQGEIPAERAFKMLTSDTSKVVDSEGQIVIISTSELVGGVIFGLIDRGEITADQWPQPKVLELSMKIGEILGKNAEHRRMIRSASQASRLTATGLVVPITWLETERDKQEF